MSSILRLFASLPPRTSRPVTRVLLSNPLHSPHGHVHFHHYLMDPVSGICTCVLCTADDRDIHTNATTNTTSREIRPPSQQTMDRIMARIRENQDTVQHDRQVAREWQSSYQRRTHHTIEREMQRAEARWLAEPMLPTGEPRSQFPTRRDPTLVESVRRFSQGSELAVVQDYEFAIPNSESVHRSAPQTPAERTPTRRTLVDSAINLALTDSVGEQWNILPEFTRTVISSTSLELQAPPPPSYSQSIEPGTVSVWEHQLSKEFQTNHPS